MKLSIVAVFVLASFSHGVLAAKSDGKAKEMDLSTYKCHLLLASRGEVIKDFRRLPANYAKKLQVELVGKTASINGNDKYAILEVKECVVTSGTFRTAQARELDRLTLR